MFGYLRFTLALLVVLSHIGVRFYSLNPGVVAVVIFYMLAGYVVSHLLRDIFAYNIKKFYKDRLLRIYPLYLYVLSLTLLFVLITSFGNPHFTPLKLLYNFTIIPINYYMYIDSALLSVDNTPWQLIPPAWSLATELQAYLLLPFIIKSKKKTLIFTLFSFTIYMLANLSFLHADYYGYRFVVGVLFIFLLGSMLQSKTKEDKTLLVTLYLLLLTYGLYCIYTNSFSPAYTKETLLGILIGVPLLYILPKTKKKLPYNTSLGALSYGLFLTHFPSIWFLKYLGISPDITLLYILELLLVSLLFSIIGIAYVEKRLKMYLKISR